MAFGEWCTTNFTMTIWTTATAEASVYATAGEQPTDRQKKARSPNCVVNSWMCASIATCICNCANTIAIWNACSRSQSSFSSTCHFFSICWHLFSTLTKLLIKHIPRGPIWVAELFRCAHIALANHVAICWCGACSSSFFLSPGLLLLSFCVVVHRKFVLLVHSWRVNAIYTTCPDSLVCFHFWFLLEVNFSSVHLAWLYICVFCESKRNKFGYSWGTLAVTTWHLSAKSQQTSASNEIRFPLFSTAISYVSLCDVPPSIPNEIGILQWISHYYGLCLWARWLVIAMGLNLNIEKERRVRGHIVIRYWAHSL